MAKSSSNILALGVGLNLDPLNKDITNAAKTAKDGMATLGQSVVDGGAKASGATEKLGDKVQTMRQQLRMATQDAQAMAEKYGIMSTQAIASASRAGELKDKIGDINTVITAFSADSKFTVVAGALQSAAGAATIVTGAMGLLGTESKATQEMLLKVQSALALTQGLAQIKEMGASFTALRAVIVGQVIPSITAMGVELIVATGGAVLVLAAIAYAVNDYSVNLKKNEQQLALNAQREKDYAEAIRKSKEELIAKTRELKIELAALQQGVTVDEFNLKQKESQVIAFNALIEKNKKFNESIKEENELKRKQLTIQNMASLRYISEAEYGIVQERNNQGLIAKVQLLKDEIEQGKIQLDLSKQIENLKATNKGVKEKPEIISYIIKTQYTKENAGLGDFKVNVPALPQSKIKPTFFDEGLSAALINAKIKVINGIADIKNSLESGIVNVVGSGLAGLGEGIAGALSGDNDPFEAFGVNMIKSLGAMAVQLGEKLLAIGAGMLFVPGMQAEASMYLLGGAALVVAGATASGLAGRKSKPNPNATPSGGGGNISNPNLNSNYIGGNNSGKLVIEGYVRGNDINFVNGKSGSKNNRSLRFG